MARKKNFTESTEKQVFNSIQAAAAEDAPKAEAEGVQKVSFAMTATNYDYVKSMAVFTGQTMTEFFNQIVAKSREDNAELYNKIVSFRKDIK